MKKIFTAFIFIFAISACSDLEEDFTDNLTDGDFFFDEENTDLLLADSYQSLYGFAYNRSVFGLQEFSSDEMAPTKEHTVTFGAGEYFGLFRHQYGEFFQITQAWDFCYDGIHQINRYLKIIETAETDLDIRPWQAELKVLRALFYYWLIDLYGNVPIIKDFDGASLPETQDRSVVFDFIEKEILDNLDFLEKRVDQTTYAKVIFYTAQTLLAKLYLNAEIYTGTAHWAKTAEACNAVIDAGVYELENDYFDNFKEQNESSRENIFVIPFDEKNAGGFFLAAMTLHFQSQETYQLNFQPWNAFTSVEEFYNSFDENDDRINSFITGPQFKSDGVTPLTDSGFETNDPDGPQINFTPKRASLQYGFRQEGARVGKFEIAPESDYNMNNDFPIFRYADVLLMKAEALWRMNPGDSEALLLVNQIRQRSNAEPFTELTAENLLAERGREMFCEAWRRSDLIRFGKFNDERWEKPADPSPHVNLFPIPIQAISVNPKLRQNPGY